MTAGRTMPRAPIGALLVVLLAVAAAGLVSLVGLVVGDPTPERVPGSGPEALAPVGSSTDGYRVWAHNEDGTPVRWNPCAPIDVVTHAGQAPDGWRDDLEVALAAVTDASGISFRVLGPTQETPVVQRAPYQPDRYGERWAPVLLAWADPGAGGLPLRASDRGLAIPVAVGPAGDRTYVTGQVVLNQQRDDLVAGFDDRATSWGATLLHELGHLLGLAHSDDDREMMATFPGEGPVRFGPGDRAGLRAVGRDAGCREVPDAQPVEVPQPLSPGP